MIDASNPFWALTDTASAGGTFAFIGAPSIAAPRYIDRPLPAPSTPLSFGDVAGGIRASEASLPEPSSFDASVHDLIVTGPSNNRVDIWFVGDGYTAGQLDLLIADAQAQFDWLTDHTFAEPFGSYADLFNLRVLFVPSAEEGADRPSDGVFVDTAFDASYSWDGSTERLLYFNDFMADDALFGALPDGVDIDMRFGVVNSDVYGGGGGLYAVYAAGNSSSRSVALHEMGHSFAYLADEYWEPGSGRFAGYPTAPNVSLDATGTDWQAWLGYDDGILGPIGAYEGGQYAETGIYRPTENSLMRSLDRPFDAIAREQFVLRFYDAVDPLDAWSYAGETELTDMFDEFWIDPLSEDLIKQEWRVDGELVGRGTILDIAALDLGRGVFDIEVTAFDDTPFVRTGRDALQQTVSWELTLTYALQRGSAVADRLEGDDGRDRLEGLDGDDMIVGFGGGDMIMGGAGDDVIYGDGVT